MKRARRRDAQFRPDQVVWPSRRRISRCVRVFRRCQSGHASCVNRFVLTIHGVDS
jgi:hypothetical protein